MTELAARQPTRASRGALLLLMLTAMLLIGAAPARATVAQIADPADDVPLSFNQTTDVTGVTVAWENGELSVAVTYKGAPRATTFGMYVSEAAADQTDPDSTDCDAELTRSLTVGVSNERATLTVPTVDGKLTASPVWTGLTVTYTFASPTLVTAWARADPFTCVSGSADGDDFFGAFPGRTLKLTERIAKTTLEARLASRFGDAFSGSEGLVVACPPSAFEKATEGQPARAWCTWEFSTGASLLYGWGTIVLPDGQPKVIEFRSRRLAGAYRGCGTFGTNGRGKNGWWTGPVFGASTTVWAKRTSCTTARRVARSRRPASRGWKCRTLKSGWEYILLRCSRPGGRAVRIEGGS